MATIADVKSLLHFDGADASTTFVESASSAVWTPHGTAKITTAQSVFGGACAEFDGSGWISTPHQAAFTRSSGLFAYEMRLRFKSAQINTQQHVMGQADGFGANVGFRLTKNSDRTLTFTGSGISNVTTGMTVSADTWYCVSYQRDGTTARVFLDGALIATGTYTLTASTSTNLFSIGRNGEYSLFPFYGFIDEFRFTEGGVWNTAAYTPASAAFTDPTLQGRLAADSPLGEVRIGPPYVAGRIADASLLGQPSVLAFHDFSALINPSEPIIYVADLLTPGGPVRAPISSWQATLRAGEKSYVQCVIPACAPLVDDIVAATEFVIYRRATLTSGQVIEYEMARAPAQTKPFDQGPLNHTCTLSGYVDGLPEQTDPPAAYDRTLTGIRSEHSGDGNYRVRCAVDWFLRPGQRAYVDGVPFIVGYINYYVPGFDQYMDVGEVVP